MADPIVRPNGSSGILSVADRTFACAVGKGGIVSAGSKREGDGATPAGVWKLRAGFWRADRLEKPPGPLAFTPIAPDMVWDDDPTSPTYNTLQRRALPDHPERLMREDGVYDIVVPLGFNDGPIVPGRGSAIFLHVARDGYPPTAGCVALPRDDLLELLGWLDVQPAIDIRND